MLILIFVFLAAGVILWDLYSRSRAIRRGLRCFSGSVQGAVFGGFFMKYSVNGELDGVRFSVWASPGGNRSRPALSVVCYKGTPFRVTILKNELQSDFFARMAKVPVLCSIVKTNDPFFDSRFSIYSHNNAEVAGYFYNTGRKNAAAGILDRGFSFVRFNGKSITARKYDFDPERDMGPGTLKAVLDHLIVLTGGL